MPRSFPQLTTARLLLRIPLLEDFGDWAKLAADEQAMRFLGGAQSEDEARLGFAAEARSWALLGSGLFSVVERETNSWVGRVGIWNPAGWPVPEIAWAIASRYQGRGFASEAAAACIDFATEGLGWSQIAHLIDTENHASVAVARRLGASRQGSLRLPASHGGTEVECWGQSAAQWRSGCGRTFTKSSSSEEPNQRSAKS